MTASPTDDLASAERRIQELTKELSEAREQQAATSEVLGIISRSQADIHHVFSAIMDCAVRLCRADLGGIYRVENGLIVPVALHPNTTEYWKVIRENFPRPVDKSSNLGRALVEGKTIHATDGQAVTYPGLSGVAKGISFRCQLSVPLLRNGHPIGVLALMRRQPEPYSPAQIALVNTFADQAVIAIENTRLFEAEQARTRELTERTHALAEALNHQTATSDVLNIISRSPTNPQPVFDTIVKSAVRLCGALLGALYKFDGELMHVVAHHNFAPEALNALHRVFPARASRALFTGRAILERKVVHIPDVEIDDPDHKHQTLSQTIGVRSGLYVPVLRDGSPIGVIAVARSEPGSFSHTQIELLKTFADQAVIAIENTRLFEEVRQKNRALTGANAQLSEALEQQTATADILRVISSSPTDVQPVLDAVAENAAHLCMADDAQIYVLKDNLLVLGASHGLIPPFGTRQLSRGWVTGRAVIDCRTIHVHDLAAEAEAEYPVGREAQRLIGHRTTLATPLLRKGVPLGAVLIRRMEVRPFSERQIKLLETFADQAAIAIENTRLFEAEQASKRELQQSLEYQTATGEVLGVISRSPTDVQPVFNAIARSAAELCKVQFCHMFRFDGGLIHFVASHGLSPKEAEAMRTKYPIPPGRASAAARSILTATVEEIPNVDADSEFEHGDVARLMNYRSIVAVPMTKDSRPIGAIVLMRSQAGRFPDRQINLLKTFADQAVIAIENTRLFEAEQASKHELLESLEYQTATAEVLNVISRSPTELRPVLDAIAKTARRLCQAERATVMRLKEGRFHLAAWDGPSNPAQWKYLSEHPLAIEPGSMTGRVAIQKRTIHVHDVRSDPSYRRTWEGVDNRRTMLGVPLMRFGAVTGVIVLTRAEVRPFTTKQIELVATFADQALIAIENTRLFEEVQARNAELNVALEQQTATSELLKVIGQSTFDLQPVFETLAENAVRLCEAERAFIFQFDGQFLRAVASHNASAELRAFIEQHPQATGRGSATARAALERRTVHVRDVQADPEYTYASRQVDPIGTIIAIPMLRARELLGVITIYRHEVLPFTDGHIALLETFADQAAIAIENTRLFEEVQARNRDLTALGEVGRAVSSTLNLKIVLKTIVDRAVDLSGTDAGSIFYFRQELGRFELGETSGLDGEAVSKYRKLNIAEGQTGLGEAIANRQPLQVPDVTKRASNSLRDAALEAGLYAALIVPLLSAEGPLGALVLQRRQAGEFPHAVVNLMQAFADQSTIALENARLFDEIAQKGRELEIASRHKSQFVANMSHELRTPLAAILGYAELMQEGFYEPLGQKSLDALTRIRSNGKHLLGLINTVLDIAKIESGQFTLNMTEYVIESVVETVRAATESLAQNKKLTLTTSVDKSLPVGLGDEQRLTQVLLNLVGNAIKFTDAGEVRIAAGARNGHFSVSVTDTGPGIPVDQQDRIFEQFHQVDSSNTKAKGGTGLGLAIAKQIVEMHGGRIWVVSTPGKGSTFQMELPTRAEFRKPAL